MKAVLVDNFWKFDPEKEKKMFENAVTLFSLTQSEII